MVNVIVIAVAVVLVPAFIVAVCVTLMHAIRSYEAGI